MKRRALRKYAERRLPPLISAIVNALDAKKAEDLRVLDVSAISSITNTLILATGTSEPHLRALRIELERVLKEQRAAILGVESGAGSGWIVVDSFDVMIHLFSKDSRARYRLDLLWKDAQLLDLGELLDG